VPIVRISLIVALLALAIAAILELAVPDSAHIIDIAAAICGVATWIAPPFMIGMNYGRKPPTSLASVGRVIGIVSVCAVLSALSFSLAVLSLVFARGGTWALLALASIAAFWLLFFGMAYIRRPSSLPTERRK
jgi:hypothetical protein